jgi:hypothetical protein
METAMTENAIRPASAALPETVMDLLAQRKSMAARSLNNDVEDCHLKCWENPAYRKFFQAIWKEEAVEGSFIADDISAAMMIRDFAIKNRLPIAANAKLHAIVHSLGVVCRRYQMDRNTRRRLVGDTVVQVDDDEPEKALLAA